MSQEVGGEKIWKQNSKDVFEKLSYKNRGIRKCFKVMHASQVSAVFPKKRSERIFQISHWWTFNKRSWQRRNAPLLHCKRITKGAFLCLISLYSALNWHLSWTWPKFAGTLETRIFLFNVLLAIYRNRGLCGLLQTYTHTRREEYNKKYPGVPVPRAVWGGASAVPRVPWPPRLGAQPGVAPPTRTNRCLQSNRCKPQHLLILKRKEWKTVPCSWFLSWFSSSLCVSESPWDVSY